MVLQDGYSSILSCDYSPVAIQRLEAARQQLPPSPLRDALSYEVADMRSMQQHVDCAFGGVLDKGALDALLCGDDGEAEAAKAVREVKY